MLTEAPVGRKEVVSVNRSKEKVVPVTRLSQFCCRSSRVAEWIKLTAPAFHRSCAAQEDSRMF